MKRLLFTTILSTMALAGTAYAQTPPDITAPEGFVLQDDLVTSDSLLGATIYDAAGDAIGAVGDLVFDLGTADGAMTDETMTGAAQTPDMAETGTTQEGMNVEALEGVTAEGLDGEAGEQVVPGTNDAINGVGGGTAADPATNAATAPDAMENPDAENDPVGAVPDATEQDANPDNAQVFGGAADQSNTDVDGSDVDGDGTADPGLSTGTGTAGAAATGLDATAQTEAEAMEDVQTPDDPTATTDGDAATDADLAANDQTDAAAADLAAAHEGVAAGATPMTDGAGGQITHAILDIGGFLGLGQHSVAIPISDLTVYASGDELRVYLPWTRAQLEALPAYDANDPATLGTSLWSTP